jgi:ATP-dependent DNA helicase RecG
LTITEAILRDASGRLPVIWFNQPYLGKTLKPGQGLIVSGKVDWKGGRIQMTSPHFELLRDEQTHAGRIIPVYPVTLGLTPKFIRGLVRQVLPLAQTLPDPIPGELLKAEGLPALSWAISALHFPNRTEDIELAQRRLDFNALLRIQLESLQIRALQRSDPAPQLAFRERETKRFVAQLPWKLTLSQRRAAWAILRDLEKPHPMNRLLQGDVGSGKTVVAAIAMLTSAWNGHQSVLMAPTEILAEQHFRTLKGFFGHRLPVALLTGSQARRSDRPSATKRGLKLAIRQGKLPVVVGTHALLQADVQFQRLGLAVVDEQHRFGVNQRQRFREQASLEGKALPHFLSMTATPIPRTVALTLYSDLDVSSLTESPKDRKRTITKLIGPAGRASMEAFLEQELRAGHQAFVVTPLIEESDALGITAATATHARLQSTVFPKYTIGLLHGRMTAEAKERVMKKFLKRDINVLVSTAVIEVGIDVPNATVMVIESAERFGYAQLHQFRGRVGRGEAQAYCFLVSDSGAAAGMNKRLLAFSKLKNGFEVAEADFALRGPGELRGHRQSGTADVSMDSLKDIELIKRARAAAEQLLRVDPTLAHLPGLRRLLDGQGIHWE